MNTQKPQLLLVTNGFEDTRPAMEYGIWLAGVMKTSITLLGVQEPSDAHHPARLLVEEMTKKMEAADIPHQVEIRTGHTEEALSLFVKGGDYLVFLGPLGRPPLRRFVMGRSIRNIMAEVSNPILYVPAARYPVRKILVCMGGLEYALGAARLAMFIASLERASLMFLHVVEPITLEYPLAREVRNHWQNLLDTNTPQGHTLRQVLEESQPLGLPTAVKVRHGNVVPEILEEIREGNYDLICMGSAYSAHSLRHLYLPNVTAEVAEASHRPILTVRYSVETID